MYREKFNLKYNFCYYYFSVMKDMTSESPTLLIYILKRKTSSSIYIYKTEASETPTIFHVSTIFK